MYSPKPGVVLGLLLSLLTLINCACYNPSPSFPPPKYDAPTPEVQQAFENAKASIAETVSSSDYDTTSFSCEITSSKKLMFTFYHTAKHQSASRPGTTSVSGSSSYRIASITKVFTVLGILQQHAKGTLHLDDAVSRYLPELSKKQTGTLPFHDITLRALGSQLSGIPGDLFQSDIINELSNPEAYGLPPRTRKGLPTCDEYSDFERPCSKKDLIDQLRKQTPTFAPAQQPSYCNVGFEILGLVLEKVTKMGYSEYVHQMLEDLEIEGITFDKPDDQVAVLPLNETLYWDVELGVQRPTGGLYSGSSSLSALLRYILAHYNGITTGALNWLHPSSYSYGINSFYGMPWEIFRSDKVLEDSAKPVAFVTKAGGLPGYYSIVMLVPDYDLGITILVAGNGKLMRKIRQILTEEFIPAVELLAQRQVREKYAGVYRAAESTGLDSFLELALDTKSGLYIKNFVSNGTDVLKVLAPSLAGSVVYDPDDWRMQLVPTLLFAKPEKQEGELWRALLVPQEHGQGGVWEDFCTVSIDSARYAGKNLNELVFWTDCQDKVTKVELSAFEVFLQKKNHRSSSILDVSDWDETPMFDEL